MKKILTILIVIASLFLIKFLTTYILNEIVIAGYNRGIYSTKIISFLKKTNINEPYIVYYNEGNIFYQKGRYDKAAINYETALEKNPPHKKRCDIRINLTLALVKNINMNSSNKELIIKKLEAAKKELYRDQCANEKDDQGESEEAEELEKELEEQIDKLKKELEEEKKKAGKGNEKGQEEKDSGEDEKEFQKIEEQLNEINKDANANRQKDLQSYENLGTYHYYTGKNW